MRLRPDWEEPHPAVDGLPLKLLVSVYYHRARARHDRRYAALLQLTGDAELVEDSPRDFEWGGRDEHGGFIGRNLLGISHMTARAALPPTPAPALTPALLERAKLSHAPRRLYVEHQAAQAAGARN